VQALRNAGDTLTDTFSYTVRDTAGATATATFTVTIHGANDAPALGIPNGIFFDANAGRAVTLHPALTLRDVDSPTLVGASVTIGSGHDNGDRLVFTNQNGITGSYDRATGVLTMAGVATVAQYEAALRSVGFIGDAQRNGIREIIWQVNDGGPNGISAVTSTRVQFNGLIVYVPLPQLPSIPGHHGFTPDPISPFGRLLGGLGGEPFRDSSSGPIVYFVRGGVQTKVADNANIEIQIPLDSLGAPLGGDVASVTAQLADGQPLPSWLKFDPAKGTFTGQVPDEIVTGSLPGQGGAPDDGSPQVVQPTTMTIKVVVRDSKGQQSVMTFTVTLPGASSTLAPGGERRTDLLPTDGGGQGMLPAELERAVAAAIEVPAAAPAGRAGLSEQLNRAGWRAMNAQRTALLDSLRGGATVH
jgi:hypothetical protein